MTAFLTDLALFPLHTVLYPGGVLPLKIFETRYMDMVKDCLRHERPFGVCLIKEGAEVGNAAVPSSVGCLARIVDWDMPQLGILHVRTLGAERFRVHEVRDNGRGLLLAHAELVEHPMPAPVASDQQICATVLRAIVSGVGREQFPQPLDFGDANWVGYRLAEVLPLPLPVKQHMLEMQDSALRLSVLKELLREHGLIREPG